MPFEAFATFRPLSRIGRVAAASNPVSARIVKSSNMAERQGFEPWAPFGTTVFKTVAIDRSAISP